MIRLRLLLALCLIGLTGCTHVFYHPTRIMYFPPELTGFVQQNIYFFSDDGARLHGWFFRARNPVGTIVQFHGNAENQSSHYMSLAWLTKERYNLFTFDYRGYGESLGDPNQKGTILDGVAALNTAMALHKETQAKKFIVYGQSLGGAIALRSLNDFEERSQVGLVVIDSSFRSYKDVAQSWLAHHWPTWIFSPLARVLVSDEFAPLEFPKLNGRLLVIHDKNDPVVRISNGRELFASAPEPKFFWELDQGRHVGIFAPDNPKERRRFVDFLKSDGSAPRSVVR